MITLGSRLRVELSFLDVAEDGTTTPIDLTGVAAYSVRVIRPSGAELADPELGITDLAAGETYWDAAAGVLDELGYWTIQGIADDYRSAPVTIKVLPNP